MKIKALLAGILAVRLLNKNRDNHFHPEYSGPNLQIFKLTKNIILDLGGIFMNLDFKLTEQAFIDLGITEFAAMFNQYHSNDLFEQLETGKISPEIFYEAFRNETRSQLTDQQIKQAWNALLLDFPAETSAVRQAEWFDHYLKGKPAPDWMANGIPRLQMADHLASRKDSTGTAGRVIVP